MMRVVFNGQKLKNNRYMKQTKNYQEMNEAEQTILDYLQMAEYRKYNRKPGEEYTPIDGIEILREIAEKLNLI